MGDPVYSIPSSLSQSSATNNGMARLHFQFSAMWCRMPRTWVLPAMQLQSTAQSVPVVPLCAGSRLGQLGMLFRWNCHPRQCQKKLEHPRVLKCPEGKNGRPGFGGGTLKLRLSSYDPFKLTMGTGQGLVVAAVIMEMALQWGV